VFVVCTSATPVNLPSSPCDCFDLLSVQAPSASLRLNLKELRSSSSLFLVRFMLNRRSDSKTRNVWVKPLPKKASQETGSRFGFNFGPMMWRRAGEARAFPTPELQWEGILRERSRLPRNESSRLTIAMHSTSPASPPLSSHVSSWFPDTATSFWVSPSRIYNRTDSKPQTSVPIVPAQIPASFYRPSRS